jgi:hypothetical protein
MTPGVIPSETAEGKVQKSTRTKNRNLITEAMMIKK